jgi:uncharacterized protein YxjI
MADDPTDTPTDTPTDPPNDGPTPAADKARAKAKSAWTKPQGDTAADRVKDQLQRQAGLTERREGGGGGLLTEPVLVVNQKAKLIELTNEHEVFDQDGTKVGSVDEINQTAAKKVARLVTQLDQFMTHTYEIREADGTPIMSLTRPRKFMKSRFLVTAPDGSEIGAVKQNNVFGKINFTLESGGTTLGAIKAKNWRAWDFHIEDAGGREVAKITKTFGGVLKSVFTTADNYALEILEPIDGALRYLVVAAALCIDTALKQDDRGIL